MHRRQSDPPSLDALYAGRCTLAELEEYEATRFIRPLGGRPNEVEPPTVDDEYEDEPLVGLKFLGQPRKWRDTKCRCDKPLAQIEWNGHDAPLEQWCVKCGRVMPRPYDARYPLPAKDRGAAQPTVEVGIVAEPVR